MSYLTRLDELRRAELYQRACDFAEKFDPAIPSPVILPRGMGPPRCSGPAESG